jgi:hypothetical protein
MVVGEISDSFSTLDQSVSRGAWESRCASGSETAGQAPRHDSRMTAHRSARCFSNTGKKHDQPGPRHGSTRGADLEAQIAQVAQRGRRGPDACSLWRQQRGVGAQREYTYGAFASLPVLTVTGVPRSLSEPWRP